jgi:hypothetical protein
MRTVIIRGTFRLLRRKSALDKGLLILVIKVAMVLPSQVGDALLDSVPQIAGL